MLSITLKKVGKRVIGMGMAIILLFGFTACSDLNIAEKFGALTGTLDAAENAEDDVFALGEKDYDAFVQSLDGITFDETGSFSETIFWKLNTQDGILVIFGSGELVLNHDDYKQETDDGKYEEEFLWHNNDLLKTAVISEGITKITGDKELFGICRALENLYLSKTIETFPGSALTFCGELQNIVLQEGNPYYCVKDQVLYTKDMTRLVRYPCGISAGDFDIPNGVQTIGTHAFQGSPNLREIRIPESVITIERDAFDDCENLKQITIPDSVTTLEESTFSSCESLEAVTLSSGLTEINDYMFWNCTALTTVTIPNGIESIGYMAFTNCSSLKEIILPESVTSIGGNAFERCSSLSTIVLPKNLTYIGDSAFYKCTSISSLTIPFKVEEIGDGAFWGWTAEQRIILENAAADFGYDWKDYCNAQIST